MSEEKKVMCHVFLVSFAHTRGFGNFYHYRIVGNSKALPSQAELESLEKKINDKHKDRIKGCWILSVSELQDEMIPVSKLDF